MGLNNTNEQLNADFNAVGLIGDIVLEEFADNDGLVAYCEFDEAWEMEGVLYED